MFIAILIVLLILFYPAISFYLNGIGENGTITGEVFEVCRDNTVFIKALDDPTGKALMQIYIGNETEFASGDLKEEIREMSELQKGTLVEIEYTYKPNLARYEANNIKTVDSDAQSRWKELELEKDYSWKNVKLGSIEYGEVKYVTKLTSPIEGYLIYLEDRGMVNGFVLKGDNRLVSEEIWNLLDQGITGYSVKIQTMESLPFREMLIGGVFYIELLEK